MNRRKWQTKKLRALEENPFVLLTRYLLYVYEDLGKHAVESSRGYTATKYAEEEELMHDVVSCIRLSWRPLST